LQYFRAFYASLQQLQVGLHNQNIISNFIKTIAVDWVTLTLSGPNVIADNTLGWFYYVNNVLIGTPPATESLLLDVSSSTLAVSSDDCAFCAGGTLFDPTLSSTYKVCGFDAYSFLDHLESCR
jgi:Eukaryotic aspartyl protease